MRTNTFFKLFSIGGVIALLLAVGATVALAQTSTVFDEPADSPQGDSGSDLYVAPQAADRVAPTADQRMAALFDLER